MDPPGRKFNMDPPGQKFDNLDSMTRGVDPPGRLDIIHPAPTAPMAPTVSTIIPDKSTSDTTLPASPSTPPASSATTSETPPMICDNDVVYSYVACNHLMSSYELQSNLTAPTLCDVV